jgi:hypothetical protein
VFVDLHDPSRHDANRRDNKSSPWFVLSAHALTSIGITALTLGRIQEKQSQCLERFAETLKSTQK